MKEGWGRCTHKHAGWRNTRVGWWVVGAGCGYAASVLQGAGTWVPGGAAGRACIADTRRDCAPRAATWNESQLLCGTNARADRAMSSGSDRQSGRDVTPVSS